MNKPGFCNNKNCSNPLPSNEPHRTVYCSKTCYLEDRKGYADFAVIQPKRKYNKKIQ